MGVPKFFRFISERYPQCSQLIQENNIPEFDNLYLDMNGKHIKNLMTGVLYANSTKV